MQPKRRPRHAKSGGAAFRRHQEVDKRLKDMEKKNGKKGLAYHAATGELGERRLHMKSYGTRRDEGAAG